VDGAKNSKEFDIIQINYLTQGNLINIKTKKMEGTISNFIW
jgi:hypothetical protein